MFGQEIASLFVTVGADTARFERGLGRVDDRLGAVGGAMRGLTAAAGAVLAGAAALGGGLGAALGSSSGFDRAMSGVAAVTGATDHEMELLSGLALQLGRDTAFGAGDAARALEMLGKNGLSASEILSGAGTAAVNLAAAAGADLTTAADVATDVMAQFGLGASELDRAINGVAGVIVNSKFDIGDYALALSQGGGVAASAGLSLEGFNAAMVAISSGFGSGSDAGTSFKTMLQRLVPQSATAAAAMQRLGFISADGVNKFFDAQGNLRGVVDIAGLLSSGLAGLSDSARLEALGTIFGTDAMRAAAGLASAGAGGLAAVMASIEQGSAAGQASTRLDNLAGDTEALRGTFETLKITVGQAFTPLARATVQTFNREMQGLLGVDWALIADGVERINVPITEIGRVIPSMATTAKRWGRGLGDALGGLLVNVRRLKELRTGDRGWAGAGAILASIGRSVGDWARLGVTWLGDAIADIGERLGAGLWPGVQAGLGSLWSGLVGWVTDGERVGNLGSLLGGAWTGFTEWAGELWPEVQAGLGSLWSGLVSWITEHGPKLRAAAQGFSPGLLGFIGGAMGEWARQSPRLWGNLERVGVSIVENLVGIGAAFSELFGPGSGEFFGRFTAQFSVAMIDIWGIIAERLFDNLRIMVESVANMKDAFGAFGRGDWAGVKAAAAVGGTLLGEMIEGNYYDFPADVLSALGQASGLLGDDWEWMPERPRLRDLDLHNNSRQSRQRRGVKMNVEINGAWVGDPETINLLPEAIMQEMPAWAM